MTEYISKETVLRALGDAMRVIATEGTEIIRCKNCEYYHPSYCEVWSRYGTVQTREDGFCHKAERRIDAETEV